MLDLINANTYLSPFLVFQNQKKRTIEVITEEYHNTLFLDLIEKGLIKIELRKEHKYNYLFGIPEITYDMKNIHPHWLKTPLKDFIKQVETILNHFPKKDDLHLKVDQSFYLPILQNTILTLTISKENNINTDNIKLCVESIRQKFTTMGERETHNEHHNFLFSDPNIVRDMMNLIIVASHYKIPLSEHNKINILKHYAQNPFYTESYTLLKKKLEECRYYHQKKYTVDQYKNKILQISQQPPNLSS